MSNILKQYEPTLGKCHCCGEAHSPLFYAIYYNWLEPGVYEDWGKRSEVALCINCYSEITEHREKRYSVYERTHKKPPKCHICGRITQHNVYMHYVSPTGSHQTVTICHNGCYLKYGTAFGYFRPDQKKLRINRDVYKKWRQK